jgi:hypothetical protein
MATAMTASESAVTSANATASGDWQSPLAVALKEVINIANLFQPWDDIKSP